MVIDRGRNWARMFERQRYELVPPSEMPPVPAQYKVEWKGPHHKFCAIRVQDKSTVQEGFPDRAAADAWVKNFETVTA